MDQDSVPPTPPASRNAGPRYTFRSADGQMMEVPPEGNLGLLAAGYRGIMLWREARAASGWTPAKAAEASRLAFKEHKQASKASPPSPEEPGGKDVSGQ
jgi:hypothetical protein